MNCDKCYENYFLLNGTCLEIPKCEYNYYYDIDLNLECINKDNYCPNFKPYENRETKECIEKCDIKDLNAKICNPTNNPVSINETYKKIFNNIKYLNLEEKLLKNEEEFSIFGNNVSFIFSTTDIEKKNLYNKYNGSSIILNKCEDILKRKYLISEENPIPILKIESSNRNSSNIEIFYELFNPKNLSEKLDLNLCSPNYIEIRLPLVLKQYKMDLIFKTRDLGYNILDLNNSFYNDICSVFIYNDSDFSLSERRTLLDFSDENLNVPGCNYTSFDIKTIRTIYLCKIGNDTNNNNSLNEVKINDNDEENFLNKLKKEIKFSKVSNINIMKCFSIILNSKLFTENHGFYIMFLMNIINILLFIFSFPSKLDKQLNIFCNIILSQMKKIYNKKQNKINLKIKDAKINDNSNVIKDKAIDINNNNSISINTTSKKDNTNNNDNQEINIEKTKNGNLFNDKQRNSLTVKVENNKDLTIDSYNNKIFKEVIIDTSKKEASNINNNELSFNTYQNESNKEFNIDISKIENIKENSSQRDLKTKKNKINPKNIKDINPKNIDSLVKMKKNNINILLNNLDNINNDKNKSNYNGKDEHKIIEELKKKNNSNLYLFYVIKYIPFKKRKKYISEYEMENLPYDYALQMEDRNNSDFYFSLLREKNKIISIFLNDKDFNIQAVKIALFIFNFNLSLAVNALFFTDEAIYQINQDEGSFNLSAQISRIVYSAVISIVITYIVELLAFTHKSIIKLRYFEDIKKAKDSVPILLRILKIKIMAFFIIIIFFDIIFFYYITVFCSVYSKIQMHMLKNSFLSFLLTNSYSVILYIFASFIRIFSKKKKSKFRYLLYLISWIISFI